MVAAFNPMPPRLPFRDRREGGRVLSERLRAYAGRPDVLVLALPRGGVPVGYEVARALGVPLDVLLVRKLGVPGHDEVAMGAIASGDVRVLNPDVIAMLRIPATVVEEVAAREEIELRRREREYRDDRPALDARGRVVIVVDDGLATGATMRAAVASLRRHGVARVVVAVPVAAEATCQMLRPDVDELVCAAMPEPFGAVGAWYENFSPTEDAEVRELLRPPST